MEQLHNSFMGKFPVTQQPYLQNWTTADLQSSRAEKPSKKNLQAVARSQGKGEYRHSRIQTILWQDLFSERSRDTKLSRVCGVPRHRPCCLWWGHFCGKARRWPVLKEKGSERAGDLLGWCEIQIIRLRSRKSCQSNIQFYTWQTVRKK